MFEKEVKFIIDFTLNRVKRLGSFFTYEKLESAEIHPAIILYISSQLDYLIYEDRKKLLQNSSFDYSGSEIAKYFNLISEEIKRNKRLAFEDVKTLVTHAVTFNVNYIVRPNWTLNKLIFDENKTRNVNEIRMMLNYLYYYDYIKNVFLGYFSKRKIISLSDIEFGQILNKIDKQLFEEHTHDLVDNALISIGDFFNEGGLNKTRISTQSIEVFLKEKDLTEELFKLRRSIPADDKAKYEIEEIRKILYSKQKIEIKKEEQEEEKTEYAAAEDEMTETPVIEEEEIEPDELVDEETASTFDFGSDQELNSIVEESSEKPVEETADSVDEKPLADPEYGDEEIPIAEFEPEEEEESEELSLEKDPHDEFLKRYQSELKSLEELEAQLNNFETDIEPETEDKSSKDEVTKDKFFEDEEIQINDEEINIDSDKIEKKENAETGESFTFEEIMEGKHLKKETGAIEEEIKKEKKEEPETPEEDYITEELIIEEEEFTPFEDDESDMKKNNATSKEAAGNKKHRDILSFITDKEMERIVSNVFNEDEEDFVNTMERISDSESYEDATEILKTVFLSYEISPYSKDAVTLTNAVSNYFSQE